MIRSAATRGDPALVVVDLQRGFDAKEHWGPRNNLACEGNVAMLVAAWQSLSLPLVLVRHDSLAPGSPLASGSVGNEFKPEVSSVTPDLLVSKHVNSAFYGAPDLHAWLQENRLDELVLCGVQTNHCVETTARMAGNLGYNVQFVLDATFTFDRSGPDGVVLGADELGRATATNLHGEFASVVTTAAVLNDLHAGLSRPPVGQPRPASGGAGNGR